MFKSSSTILRTAVMLIVPLAGAGCSSGGSATNLLTVGTGGTNQNSNGTGAGGTAGAAVTTGPGAPGMTCVTDADCQAGRCLGVDIAGSTTKYCSHQCSTPADCADVYDNGGGFNISLPANLQGSNNVWNSAGLMRSVFCNKLTTVPAVGTDDGNQWCFFLCQANAAEVFTGTNITSCACLPNFEPPASSSASNCGWNSSIQCSIFKACVDASTTTGPCAQDVSCVVNTNLTGTCFSSTINIEDCVLSSQTTCDGTCLANNCSGTEVTDTGNDPCVQMCCSSGTGGATSTGGTLNTGGSPSAGGTTSTGGMPSSGGARNTGGSPSTGGTTAAIGGNRNTGGATSTGGTLNTGGSPSAGGTTSTGSTTCTSAEAGPCTGTNSEDVCVNGSWVSESCATQCQQGGYVDKLTGCGNDSNGQPTCWCPAATSEDVLVFTFTNSCSSADPALAAYDMTSGSVFQSTTVPYNQQTQYPINCVDGDKICWGAWNGNTTYWGCGLNCSRKLH